jgi:multiple sugar transport system substrate-binding protein
MARHALCRDYRHSHEAHGAAIAKGMHRMYSSRLFRLISLLSLAALLAGCGSGASSYTPAGQTSGQAPAGQTSGQAPAGATGAGGAKVHLVYFNARGAEPVEKKLVERYMKDHPNVEIEYLSTTSLSGPSDTDAIANLIFNIQAKRVIDVAKIEVSRTPLDLMAAKAEQEMSAIDDQVKTRLQGLFNADYVSVNNGVWALPYEYDPFAYIYNASLYKDVGLDPDNPPKSWDDLRKVNDTIKAKNPNSWPICNPIKNLAKTMPYVWTSGGDYWDRPILPTKALFTTPVVTDVYKFYQEWAQKQWINTDELSDANQLQFMISRKCGALNTSSYFIMQLQTNDPKTDWRAAPISSKDGTGQPSTFGGGSALAIPSTSANPKEAANFILWLTSEEAQRLKYGATKDLGLSDQDIFAQATPASKAVSEELKNSDAKWKQSIVTVPSHAPGSGPAYSKIYEILAAMQERILRSNANVDEELRTAQKQSQDLLDQSIAASPDLYK